MNRDKYGIQLIYNWFHLNPYISLRFPTILESDDALKLQLKDIGIELSWPIEKIKDVLPSCTPISSTPKSCPQHSLKSIAPLVEEQNIPEAKIGLASGVSAFLWLYASIQGYKPATVVNTSELPLGSGLGSSASFCVSLAAALLSLSPIGVH
ncbi:unnamed protein product [Rhodiola kirilowii]